MGSCAHRHLLLLALALCLFACLAACKQADLLSGNSTCPDKDKTKDFGCNPPNTAAIPVLDAPAAAPEQTNISTTVSQTTAKTCDVSRLTLDAPTIARVQLLSGLMLQYRLETNADPLLETKVFNAVERCNTSTQKIDVCQLFQKHNINTYLDSPLLGCSTEQLAKIANLADEYRITDRIQTPTTQNGLLRSLVFLKEPLYVTASLPEYFLERAAKSSEAVTWYDYVRKQIKIFSEQATYTNFCAEKVKAYVNFVSGDDLDKKTVVICPDFAAENNILDMAATLVHEASHTDASDSTGWRIGKFIDLNLGRWSAQFSSMYDFIFKEKGSLTGSSYTNSAGSLPGFVHSSCVDDLYGNGLACDPYFADYYVKDQANAVVNPGAYSYDVFFYERIARDTGIKQVEVLPGNDNSGRTASLSNSSPVRYYDPKLLKMPLPAIKWACDEGYVEHLTRFQKWYNSNGSGTQRNTTGASTFANAFDIMSKWQTCLLAAREQAIK